MEKKVIQKTREKIPEIKQEQKGKNKHNISTERRNPVIEKYCKGCRQLYLSEANVFDICLKCNKELTDLTEIRRQYDIKCNV